MSNRPGSRALVPAAFSPDRRQLLLLAAGGVSAFLLARQTAGAQSTPEGGWSFTDDKNQTIDLADFPQRLVIDVNAAAPLWDFGIRPVAVFGWNANENGDFGPAGGRIDSTGIDVVGDVSEPLKIEELVAADPDLIITIAWTEDLTEYWSIDAEVLEQAQAVAPIVAINVAADAGAATERFAELAAALGADLDTPELTEQRARFEEAQEALKAAVAEQSDVRFLFLGVQDGDIYVAKPSDFSDLLFYQNLGLNIIDPEIEAGMFWETLSYEQANKYPADVLMVSTRPSAIQPDEIATIPTFAAHPAVVAGQVFGWNQDVITSHQGVADALEHTTASLTASSVVNS